MNKLYLPLILLIIINNALAADQCYSCSTITNANCGEPFNNLTAFIQVCKTADNAPHNCVKFTYVYTGRNVTYRACKTADVTCSDIKDEQAASNRELLSCSICSEDFCNGSSGIAPILPLSTLFLLCIYLFVSVL